MKRTKKVPLPFPIGTLVRFYDEGWRAGHFDGMATKEDVIIRPIGPKGRVMRLVTVPLSDVIKSFGHSPATCKH